MIERMRYLGIDYGTQRIGIAVSDGYGRIAFPRHAIEGKDGTAALKEIRSLVIREGIGTVIVGLPLGMDGKETKMSRVVRDFGEKLGESCHVPIEFENEIFTTRMATHPGVEKEDVDAASAAIILQSYLDKKMKDKG